MKRLWIVMLAVAGLLAAGGADAEANVSRWPQGVCRDVTLTVERVAGSEDQLHVIGSSPDGSCVVVRTPPQTFPAWAPKSGRSSFETILQDDALMCQSIGSTTADDPTIWITADGLTDQLTTTFGNVWHASASPGLQGAVEILMVTESPQAGQVVVASGTFTQPAGAACNFPQTLTGSIVFTDPDRADLGL